MSSIILALIGGAILGIAVVGYLYVNGRIAGISGLLAQVLQPKSLLNNFAFWFLSVFLIIPFIFVYKYIICFFKIFIQKNSKNEKTRKNE